MTREELGEVLAHISGDFEPGFEYEPRRSSRQDASSFTSYRVTTPPIGGPPRKILLDASLSPVEHGTRSTPLTSFFYDSSSTVLTPSVGGLLGDKLTTIPSRTVGRNIQDSRQGLDYAKHIFDIDRLARSGVRPGQVKEAFETVVRDQNRLRGTDFGLDDVVKDLVSTCQAILTVMNPQGWSPVRVPRLSHDLRYLQRVFRRGAREIRPFLAGGVIFGEEEFVTAAGDAALIALSTPSEADIERTIAEMGEGEYVNRKFEESMDALRVADAEICWFIDLDEGFYSRGILGTWSEVVQRLNEG